MSEVLASCKKKGFGVLHAARGAQVKHEKGANSRRNDTNNTVIYRLLLLCHKLTLSVSDL